LLLTKPSDVSCRNRIRVLFEGGDKRGGGRGKRKAREDRQTGAREEVALCGGMARWGGEIEGRMKKWALNTLNRLKLRERG